MTDRTPGYQNSNSTQGRGRGTGYDPLAVQKFNQKLIYFRRGQCPMHRDCAAPEGMPHTGKGKS
jgi:hypothetical protein